MTTHQGEYDWGATRQTARERTRRAEIDLQRASEALDRTDPASPAYPVMLVRYQRAEARLSGEGE